MKTPILYFLVFLSLASVSRAEEAAPAELGRVQVAGPIPEGQQVGFIGRAHRIRFEGNRIFTSSELRLGLEQTSLFQMAARPSESLKHFLETLGERLVSGYLFSGCPDTKVEVLYEPEQEVHPILVRIDEGERYRQGRIIVRGAKGIDRQALVDALSKDKEWTPEQRMLKRIRDAVEEDAKRLPDPVGGGFDPLKLRDDKGLAGWIPGEPVAFQKPGTRPLGFVVSYLLAEQGHACARFKTFHERRSGGVADLVIDIEDPGPEPIIGQIVIDGAERFEREEILRVVGLENGQAVSPRDLDDALLGLWKSGRFYPFAIDAQARGGGGPEIDLRIRLREIDGTPGLDEPLTQEQQAVTRCIEWINRQMDGEEALFAFDEVLADGLKLTVGWSTADGLLLDIKDPERDQDVAIHYSNRGVNLLVRGGDRRMAGVVPVRLNTTKLHILPTGETKPLGITMATGFVMATEGGDQDLDVGVLLSPAIPLLKDDSFVRKGNWVEVGDGLVSFDLDSGRPVDIAGGSVTIQEGCLKERLKQFQSDVVEAKALDVDAVDWHETVSSVLLRLLPEGLTEMIGDDHLSHVGDLARLVDLLGTSEFIETLDDLGKLLSIGSAEAFEIPTEIDGFLRAGMASTYIRLGALAVVEESMPDADWPTAFAREWLLLHLSNDPDVTKNLTLLLADPSLGPVGSLICAKLVEEKKPGLSQQFLMNARDRSTADDFRNDWRILVSGNSLLAMQMNRLGKRLVDLTPQQDAQLGELLPDGFDPWRSDLLERLRRNGDEPLSEDLLAPTMVRLWTEHLEGWMKDYLDGRIIPPADPNMVAATIDGVPVPRSLVRLLRDHRRERLKMIPLPESDPAVEWTQDPALVAAIRGMIVMETIRKKGKLPPKEAVLDVLNRQYPSLAGKDDPQWIRATGCTQDELVEWTLSRAMVESFMEVFGEGLEDQPDDEALLAHFAAHEALFQSRLSTELVFVQPTTANPREWADCHRLAEAIAGLEGDGLSLEMIGKLSDHDEEAGFRVFSRVDESLDMFQLSILEAIEDLEPGQASTSFSLGDGVAAVQLKARRRDKDIGLADVEDIVRDHWRAAEVRRRAQSWFAAQEQGLEITVLGNPNAQDKKKLSPVEELYLEKPESLVARFLNAWNNLNSEKKADRDAAMEWMLAVGGETSLMEVLFKGRHRALVRSCLTRSVEADREKADALILKLAEAHADHGPSCGVHEYLTALRKEIFGKAPTPAE